MRAKKDRKLYLNTGKIISSIYFYRDKDKREIDLVIEQDGILYPIEIKTTGNPVKIMAMYFKILDNIPTKGDSNSNYNGLLF